MMLRVENLSSGYGRIAVLRDVSLDIAKGEMVALVGSNGAGKTTLLRAISGVQPITGGAIVFDGKPIHALSAHARVRAGIVQVPEGRQVFAPLAVADNLRLRDLPDGAAETMCVLKVGRGEGANRSTRHFRQLEMPSKRHAHEHDELRRRVMPIDIGARICFRIPETLGVGQHRLHRLVRRGHPAEDVVARAVENAGDPDQAISGEAFAHAMYQGHAASNCGLESQLHASRRGSLQQLRPVRRQQHLVCRDDR